MKVVYAMTSAVVDQVLVQRAQIWPADDPVVLMQPSLFSDDPRSVLTYSTPPADLLEESVPAKRSYVRHG